MEVKFHSMICVVQLTEDWGDTLFSALSKAGGKAFSNMAVGYNNVDVEAANKYGVAVGNTPVSLYYLSFFPLPIKFHFLATPITSNFALQIRHLSL